MDDTLAAEYKAVLMAHHDQCSSCQTQLDQALQLRQALQSLPTPAPAPDFFPQAIQKAAAAHQRRTLLRRTGFGSAIAAGLLLFALNLPLLQQADSYRPAAQDTPLLVTLALHETRDVRLVFNSDQALQNTRFTLQLPPEVELRGFPQQRQISWNGSLKQGQNLLVLPVIAQGSYGGDLTARIENAGKSKQFTVRLKVGDDRQAILPDNSTGNTPTVLS
jgi:hypothetical protein